MCCFATFRVLLYSIIIGGENCARDTNIKEISSEREKKKGGTTHVAKFQQEDENRENLDLRARVNEFLRSLSLDSAQKQHKNSFFWFFCLDELLQILSSSAFFVCGIEIFFFLVFHQKLFFFKKILFKSSYKRDSQTLKNLLY